MKRLYLGFVIFAALMFFLNCSTQVGNPPDPQWVQGITQGEISRQSQISILFTQPLGKNLNPNEIFSMEPRISGETTWKDDFTLVFSPEDLLPSHTRFTGSVRAVGDESIPDFDFYFHTPQLTLMTKNLTLEYEDPRLPDEPIIRGEAQFSDSVSPDEAETYLSAKLGNREVNVSWDQGPVGSRHSFRVTGLKRTSESQTVSLSMKNRGISLEPRSISQAIVPAIGEFTLLDIQPRDFGGRVLELIFSEPLEVDQDFRGLITLSVNPRETDGVLASLEDYTSEFLAEGLSFSVRNNLLRVYSNQQWPASFQVQVHPGIRGAGDQVLTQLVTTPVRLPREMPLVRFLGTGTIVPNADRAFIPIETRNLKGLMIQAIKVPDSALHQFLQLNAMSETREMDRVGHVIWQKEVDLPWQGSYSDQIIRHGIDITELAATYDPGMYHLILTFRRPHIVYDTAEDFSADEITFPFWPDAPNQSSQSSSWDWYEYNQQRQNRFDPTNDAFYMVWNDHNVTQGKNFFISTLGLMAQIDDERLIEVQILDLRTAEPVAGAKVEVLNYQQAILVSGTSSLQGSFDAKLPEHPSAFVVRVQKGSEVSYLRLQQQDSLNLSHFDVGGERNQVAVQGELYGERDVWRPGDTIHMTFVLRDRFNLIPDDHPVTYTLFDPQGTEVHRQTQRQGLQGMYYFPAQTRHDSPTGNYRGVVQVGSRSYERQVRVETVIPNRLKIETTVESTNGIIIQPQIEGTIRTTWLHGAIAGGLEATIEVGLEPGRTFFSRYDGFIFDDPSRQAQTSRTVLFDGLLDSQGIASFRQPLRVSDAPGMMNATLVTRVYEPSGVFSAEYFTQQFSPYVGYAGLRVPPGDASRNMLLTDVNHRVELALVDSQGNPRNGRIRAELYKLDWQWWWETDHRNIPNFYRRQSSQAITNEVIPIVNGTGEFNFQVNFPSWGRYMVYATDLETGHRSAQVVYIDWPGWAGRAMDGPGDAPDVLTFTSDKTTYQVGEWAKLTLPLGNQGRALVTLEANGRILSSDWVIPMGDQTIYEFAVTPEMLPNFYAHVTYVQPYNRLNDRPIRAMGVIPLGVRDSRTVLEPLINSTEVFEPGSTVDIRVTEAFGRPMAYTLAVVDEGLLGLTRFQTPDLWSKFFRKTASLLRSFDLYNQVAGAFTGELASLLTIGGSDEGLAASDDPMSRFEPVVIFHEPRELAPGRQNVHRIEIPEYLGAVRIMVVGVNQVADYQSFGRADKEVFVRKPLMALGTLPRLLSPGDEISLPVSIFALESDVRRVEVEISSRGLIEIEGSPIRVVNFDQPGDQTITFSGRTSLEAGTASVTFTARSGSHQAVHTIPVEVRMPTLPETRISSYSVEPGGRLSVPVEVFGIRGTNGVTLELSNFQPIDLDRRLSYLIQYPYGCLEQTTSSIFPQLYLDELTNLSAQRRAQISDNVQQGIDRIRQFQLSSGGFSFWPGSGTANDWASSYAGHFLLEARSKGYSVPESLIHNWVLYQKARANSANPRNPADYLVQAYRLYTLALAGQPEIGAMNRLAQNSSIPALTRWRLAAAYHLTGNRTQADALLNNISAPVYTYTGQENLYGNYYREQAMVAEAMMLVGRTNQAAELINSIGLALASSEGFSTQSSAYMLMALSKYAGAMGTGQPVNTRVTWRGESYDVQGNERVLSQDLGADGLASQPSTLVIQNQGQSTTQIRVLTRGNPSRETVLPVANGYRMNVSYYKDLVLWDPSNPLKAGEQIQVEIMVTNTHSGPLNNTALAYLAPTGWEIVNSRLVNPGRNSQLTYQDIRDDRVYTHFDLARGATTTITMDLIAAYSGRFYQPGILVEAMYEPRFMARSAGMWVQVIR